MKKLLAWVLTLAMLLSIMPTAVFAQDSVTDPVVFTKTLIQATSTQPAKIRLEAYTTGSSTTSEAKLPTDIVLVLDQSGSMDETMNNQTRLAVMKAAAEQFVADVAEMNNEAGNLYRVAVVGFASESGYNDNTEILTAIRTQTVTNTTYQRVQGELDTDQTYYIRSGQDYRAIQYNARNNGWYTTGWNSSEVNVNRTAVYERIQETSELESIGVPYNDLTSNDYSAALVNCTEAAIGDNGVIGKAIDALEGEGATRTDLGMEMAAKIFEEQPEGTYDNRDKVVVLITDGVPTTFDTFDSGVANDAVAYAKQMKDDGAHVFSMYLGNPSSQSVNFLQACSSNYPDATSISRLGTKAAESYYSAHSDASAIGAMFKGIVNSITVNSTLNEKSVVSDTLSPYFKLAADLQTTGTEQIEVYTVDKTANGWADTEVPFAPAKVTIGGENNKTISVTGFNFAAHCVTEDPKGGTGSTDYGRKLVIYIPIAEDPEADTFGGWLPTNDDAGIYQDASTTEPAITAESGHDSMAIRYTLNAAERAFHVDGTLLSDPVEFFVTFEELMNSENSVFDEMVNRLPDGLRNEGVTMNYKLYDIGTTDRESNDRNDDVLVAELTAQVAASSDVDVTDYSKWTWHVDKAEMTIPANEYFAEKVYVLVCTLTSTEEDDALTVYNYLDLSAVRGDLAHIIYGTIDEGGKTTVSDNAPGSLLGNTYTEAVTESSDSALMTFTPQEGYEIESIEYHTSTEAPFDTAYNLYSKDPGALITNVDLDGDGNVDAAELHEDGSWSFQAHNVTHGVAVEVNTRQISYTLTTNSDEGSEIINGTTYTYHATEKYNVPFQAINGYYLDELKVNDVVYDLTNESDRDALAAAYGAEFTMAKSLDADVVVGGRVEVPRTRDNHVEVTSAARSYHVTLKYYIQNSDGSYTEQTTMQEGPTAVAYGTRIMDTEAPAYMPGAVAVFDEYNYTLSDWYNTNTGTEFYGLVLMEEARMPAEDLTLHAVWTRNPDVKVAELAIEKTIQGAPGSNANFEFVALYHETLAGEAEIRFAEGDTVSVKTETMDIILTDRQAESFREGNSNIYIFEVENSGYTSHWHYDNALYALKWDDSQGAAVLYLNDQVVSDNIAAFENERVTYTFTFDANGGAWTAAVAGYAMDADNTTATTEGYYGSVVEEIAVKPIREGYAFIGWYTDEDPAVQLWTGDNTTVNLYQNTTVYAKWEVDEFNDEKDEPTGGDDIPDYKQVQFLYEAGENGSVAPVREIVTIGGTDYTDVAVSATKGAEATADSGYALDKWTYEANDDANAEAALNQEGRKILPTVSNADGGKTYTFKATFAKDEKGDEDDGGEDDIPDKYQVFVEFRSANEAQGTVNGKIRQTITFADGAVSGDVTPSLDGVTVTAEDGYAFDYWTKDALPEELSSADVETTIENVSGNTTIIFTANFAEDILEDPTVDPDPEEPGDEIPDKYQALVTYKVEGGFWKDEDNADRKAVFTLHELTDEGWVQLADQPTLGNSIPDVSEAQPDADHKIPAYWSPVPNAEDVAVDGAVYTYTFAGLLRGTLRVYLQDEDGTALAAVVERSIEDSYLIAQDSDEADYEYPASLEYNGKKYIYDGVASGELSGVLTKKDEIVEVCLQYTVDELNDEDDKPTGGDDIPDKYQALVTYKIEGGTWDGENAEDRYAVFTLQVKENGDWTAVDPAPVLGDTIPNVSEAQPDEAHRAPAYWSPTPYAEDVAENGAVYTYIFIEKGDVLSFTFDANGGAWIDAVEGYDMGEDNATTTTEGYFGEAVEEIAVEPVREGYTFLGWYTTEALTAQLWTKYNPTVNLYENTTVYAKWEKNPEPPAEPEVLSGTLYINLQDENGIALADLIKIPVEESYLIAQDSDEADYEYPASLEYNGKKYIYDGVASGELSGVVTKKDEIIVVCLQYTVDELNDEDDKPTGGDDIPDYKQVQFLYEAGENGSVAPTLEIVTIDGTDHTDVTVRATKGAEATADGGYALDKWVYEANEADANAEAALNQEGSKILPTVSNADGGKTYTFKATFAKDEKGDEDDGGEDGIPDKYQVFVEFRSANEEQGTVTGKIRQTITFADGAVSGDVTPSLDGVTVTTEDGYAFDYWTKDALPEELSSADVVTTIENVSGNTTIVFTANFAVDTWTDADETNDPEDEDTDEKGDDIPDNRQVLINYVSENAQQGTVAPALEIITLKNGKGPEDIAAVGAEAVAEEGFTFDHWVNTQGAGTIAYTPAEPVIAPEIKNAVGGEQYTFTAIFAEDVLDDPAVDPDPEEPGDDIPDKYQVVVTYKVEGGYWKDQDNADKTAVFTYYAQQNDGSWEQLNDLPTLGGSIPDVSEAQPDGSHQTPAYWSPIPNADDVAEDGAVYTYAFTAMGDTLSFTFDANGGAWIDAVEGYDMGEDNATATTEGYFGEAVEEIAVEPVREGYTFLGWYTTEALTAQLWTRYNPTVNLYENTTVYAKWEKNPEPPAEPEVLSGTLHINLQDENGIALADLIKIPVEESYLIAQDNEEADYEILSSIEYGGKKYIYDGIASGELSGVLTKKDEIIVVCLQYTVDELNDEDDKPTGGDDIPDYKQVQFLYEAGDNGSVALALEIVTIDGTNYTDVTVSATKGAEATADSGYALDKWTYEANDDANAEAALNQEGSKILPTVSNADGGKTYTFKATFAEDEKGDEDDGGEDDIPDKYQVLVEFRSANEAQGTVTGKIRQTFTFDEERGDVTPTLDGVRVRPGSGYAFDFWNKDNGVERLDDADVQSVIRNVHGGTTIVFTANFAVDTWTDAEETEDPEDDDTDVTGDGIPDYLQFRVQYFSEDLKQGAVEPEVEIFTLKDDVEEYAAKGSTAIAKPHYAFDHWNYDGDATVDFDPSQATIAPKLSNVTGGATYTFSAVFGEDNQIDPGVDPDPEVPGDEVPDQYQAIVTYRVVGGFWADGSDDDIVKVFTLYTYEKDDATGKWSWNEVVPAPTLGEVPEVTASDMHTGAWDAEISANTPVTKDVTYTYTFTPHPTYEVSYDLNGGTGAQDVDYSTVSVVEGTVVTVKEAPDLEGSIFEGYLAGETIYQPGDSITVIADVELVAQWKEVQPGEGTVTLTKVDSEDNTTTLAKVVFDLYSADGTKIGTYTTDKSGEITVENLPAGEHYWVEIRPREGYKLDKTKHEFTVSGGETTHITIENTRSEVPEVFSGEHYAYIIGKNDGLVHPEDNITRAEVATIFFRLLDEETRNKYMTKTNDFTDVPAGVWYNTAVSTMAAMGIIKGTPDGSFQPHKNITRAEFATIAARFDTNGNTSGASFTDIYGHWAQKEINIAANNGWVLGYVDGEFKPDQNISRAEAMAMVNRVLQRIPQNVDDLLPGMVTWPDNMVTSKWYYLTVQEATNSHAYERKPNGYEVWTELQEVPDWSAFED